MKWTSSFLTACALGAGQFAFSDDTHAPVSIIPQIEIVEENFEAPRPRRRNLLDFARGGIERPLIEMPSKVVRSETVKNDVQSNRPMGLSFPPLRTTSSSPTEERTVEDSISENQPQLSQRDFDSVRLSRLMERVRSGFAGHRKEETSEIQTVADDTGIPARRPVADEASGRVQEDLPQPGIIVPPEVELTPIEPAPALPHEFRPQPESNRAPVVEEEFSPVDPGLIPPHSQSHSYSDGPLPVNDHALPSHVNVAHVDLESMAPPYMPANQQPDALPWVGTYEERARVAPVSEGQPTMGSIARIPSDFVPWWQAQVQQKLRASDAELPVSVDILTVGALQYAPQILALRTEPSIRYTNLTEEAAEFDWRAFAETKWQDLNNPVGNTLTTSEPRFKNDIWNGSAGLRNRNQLGGELELSQQLGYETQNSQFFIPHRQGTSRIQLTYTQPLLNGAGAAYNQSRMVLAQIDTNRAFDEITRELQDHLTEVAEVYWELYRARATFLQRHKVLLAAEDILGTLEGRVEVDALQRQVLRARAAVATRRTDIARAAAAIRNAESRLRLLVNDPRLVEMVGIELIPHEPPQSFHVPLSMTGSLQTALMYRPEISQAIRDLRSAGVRVGMSENELLPRLDLVLETYARGLEGNADIAQSFLRQFDAGQPSYTAGLEFEVPLGNRAAKARYSRRQQELAKSMYEFRTVVETSLTDVELAVREAETSYQEILSQYQALEAAQTEAGYLEDRWRYLPGTDRSTTLLLEDLLDAQERLADTESEFVQAQVNYIIALTRVRREMGTLLQTEEQIGVQATMPTPVPVELPPADMFVP